MRGRALSSRCIGRSTIGRCSDAAAGTSIVVVGHSGVVNSRCTLVCLLAIGLLVAGCSSERGLVRTYHDPGPCTRRHTRG